MAKAVIAYDKDLPEILGRLPWEKPTSRANGTGSLRQVLV